MQNYNLNLLADTYGSGTYDSSTYQNSSTTGSSATSSAGGILTNTGFDLLLITTLATAVILIALIVRFWRKPSNSGGSETV